MLLDFYESHNGDTWTVHSGWAEGLTTRRSMGCGTVKPGTFWGVSTAPDAANIEVKFTDYLIIKWERPAFLGFRPYKR